MSRAPSSPRTAWSREEVEATVSAYFGMLVAQLRGETFRKSDVRRSLQPKLRNRSHQSIEYKFGNISAVLMELRFPSVIGYKPYRNYQSLLLEVVAERLARHETLPRLAEEDAERQVVVPTIDDILEALVEPPRVTHRALRVRDPQGAERRPQVNRWGFADYLQREARHAWLGMQGEEFAIRFEQARLTRAGHERLASRVEHVALTQGDGAGYDILSFEVDGRERLVEVKTTKYCGETPFFVSRNELEVSRRRHEQYRVYRVFGFRESPRLFQLKGAISDSCELDAVCYVASVL